VKRTSVRYKFSGRAGLNPIVGARPTSLPAHKTKEVLKYFTYQRLLHFMAFYHQSHEYLSCRRKTCPLIA
jgi:hypothetical protein